MARTGTGPASVTMIAMALGTLAIFAAALTSPREGVSIESLVGSGIPSDVIDETALAVHADLIITGTHGRRGVRRAFLGSVAERVIRTAHCAVMTVHAPD